MTKSMELHQHGRDQIMILPVLDLTAEEFDDFELAERPHPLSDDFFHVGFFWHKGKVWAVPGRLFDKFEVKSWKSMMMPIREAFHFMDILATSGAGCVCLKEVEAEKLDIDIQKLIAMSDETRDLDREEETA